MGTPISQFPEATALTGAELVPVVQGGSTVRTTVSNINAKAPVQSVAGLTGVVNLTSANISNLDNQLAAKLSTQGGVISGATTTPLVTITQDGTGAALLVEDISSDPSPFCVTYDGRVGIGTTTPSNTLDVRGSAVFGQNVSTGTGQTGADCTFNVGLTRTGLGGAVITLQSSTPGQSDYPDASIQRSGGLNGPLFINNYGTGTLNFLQATNSPYIWWQGGQQRMTMAAGGNLGIGVTAPTYPVHAKGSIGIDTAIASQAGSLFFRDLGTLATVGSISSSVGTGVNITTGTNSFGANVYGKTLGIGVQASESSTARIQLASENVKPQTVTGSGMIYVYNGALYYKSPNGVETMIAPA